MQKVTLNGFLPGDPRLLESWTLDTESPTTNRGTWSTFLYTSCFMCSLLIGMIGPGMTNALYTPSWTPRALSSQLTLSLVY